MIAWSMRATWIVVGNWIILSVPVGILVGKWLGREDK